MGRHSGARVQPEEEGDGAATLSVGSCTLDLERRRVSHPDGESALTHTEVSLLDYLIRRGGRTVGREELHRQVWGYAGRGAGRAVDHAVKRLRKKLGSPSPLETVRGEGYRLQIAPARPKLALLPPRSRWFGRPEALDAIEDRLAREPILALWGAPGVGKTRLALEYAGALQERGGYVTWIDLAGEEQLRGRLSEALADGDLPILLVLDGADVSRDDLSQLEAWSRRAPAARFLLTSSAAGFGPGLEVEPLPQELAVAMFLDRASDVGASLDPKDPAVRDVVEALDRLPQAIELAAAWTDVLSAAQLRDQLAATVGPALEIALAAGLAQMARWAQDALVQLTVFDTFTLEAASAVLDLSRHADAPPIPEVVRRLRRSAWLVATAPHGGAVRMRLLRTAHRFLLGLPDARWRAEPARQRHRRHFLDRPVTVARPFSRWDRGNVERIADDEGAPPEDRARAVLLAHYVRDVTEAEEGRSLQRLGWAMDLARQGAAPPRLLARLRSSRANGRRRTGDLQGALQDLEEALALPELATKERVHLLGVIAGVLQDRGEYEVASARLDEAFALVGELPETDPNRRWLLSSAGTLAYHAGDYERAAELLRRNVAMAAESGDVVDLSMNRMNLGCVHVEQGRIEEAQRELEDAVGLRRDLLASPVDVHLQINLSRVASTRGDLRAATAHAQEGIALARRAGWSAHEAHALGALGAAQAFAGDSEAEGTLHHALAAHRRAGISARDVLIHLAATAWRGGRPEEALARLDAAGREPARPSPIGASLRVILLAALGRIEEARALHRQFVPPSAEGPAALAALAGIAAGEPEPDRAWIDRVARTDPMVRLVLGGLG